MALAKTRFPKLLQPKRWARNGSIPDAWFIRQAADYLNHALAYRPRVLFSVGGDFGSGSAIGGSGTKTYWRCRFVSRIGATHLRFKLATILALSDVGDPYVEIAVEKVGTGTTTIRIDTGAAVAPGGGGRQDLLSEFQIHQRDVAIDPQATYNIAITGYAGGRPVCVTAWEHADPEIDAARGFVELAPSVYQPINDAIREQVLEGLVNAWRANGSMLLCWPGTGSSTPRTITGTTYTNIIDGSSTTVSASSPGYYFESEGTGATALLDLLPLVRLKDDDDLPVTIAAYAQTSSGQGNIALRHSSSTAVLLQNVGTTLQWYSADTTWSNVDAIPGSGKVDLLARHNTSGAATISVHAVCIWARDA